MPDSVKLSIVIVNYNVEHFLEQCLYSVANAIKNITAEVFVVDNDSVDGSCAMVKAKFQWVTLIENKDNVGFSRANNQAIRHSVGEYVLLLNPDTVVEEDTFEKTVAFMDKTPKSGGLGVKMIDGAGNFLPESKRGVPTPMVAFYKIFGLSKLFPRSEKFSQYHLGHLDENDTNKADILSGAFMLMRKSVLDEIGLLDEDYFMYGEDIDLSYRIVKAGYDNYYFADTTIIHYKGESTKKGSVNYVFVFYRAMIIFARKQLGKSNAKLFSFLINCAIYFRASLSIVKRLFQSIALPVIDLLFICLSSTFLLEFYEQKLKPADFSFPEDVKLYAPVVLSLVWFVMLLVQGAFKKKMTIVSFFRTSLFSSVIIFALYSLLPESYRFSRLFVFFSTINVFIYLVVSRFVFNTIGVFPFSFAFSSKRNSILVANETESSRIQEIFRFSHINVEVVKTLNPMQFVDHSSSDLLNVLRKSVGVYKANEVIFASDCMATSEIIRCIVSLSDIGIDYKIAPPHSLCVIGSNSIHTSGELYTIDINSISSKKNVKAKRMFDVGLSVILLLLSPMLVLFAWRLISESFNVFKGAKTWVTYPDPVVASNLGLPKLKEGVFSNVEIDSLSHDMVEYYSLNYARNYSSFKDLLVFLKNCRQLLF